MADLPHEEYLELAALSAAGELRAPDEHRLREHIFLCSDCRQAYEQYRLLISESIPLIVAEQLERSDPGPGWSQLDAEKRFFANLEREHPGVLSSQADKGTPPEFGVPGPFSPEGTWRHIWSLSAAAILLFVTLGYGAYWTGMRNGVRRVVNAFPRPSSVAGRGDPDASAMLASQLSNASQQQDSARHDIERGTRELAQLRTQLNEQRSEIGRLHDVISGLQARVADRDGSIRQIATEKGTLAEQLKATERSGQLLQEKYDALASVTNAASLRATALEGNVNELTKQLEQSNLALNQRDQLLEHDRDVRELIGARDLYIAEVYDVADTGATKKPYGRVFYTKGKSLIFYAYDLEDSGFRRDVTFQAWGRRGPDRLRAVNLGIFYEDNAAKKRWVLKLNDPKTLAEIDAVFVTVEHDGRKEKPSGKPLLFAYLRVDPNHP